jgi:hypothetical protein
MISKNMTSRIFQAQTGVRLLCLRGSLVRDAPRCSVAKKPAAISSVSISIPKLRSKTNAIFSRLRMSEPGPFPPFKVKRKGKLIEEQTAGQ